MTVRCPIIQRYLEFNPDATDVPLSKSLRIQVVKSYAHLRRAKVHQYAAFVSSEMLLVVWDDDALHLEARATNIIADLTKMIWNESMIEEKELDVESTVEGSQDAGDAEAGDAQATQKRKTKLINSVLVALTLCLIVITLGAGWRALAIECAVDKNYVRLALILLTPVQVFFTLVSIMPGRALMSYI